MLETSNRLFQQSQQSIPGGVNSPARAFNSVGGPPVFIEKAKGSILTDVDGKEYIDYVGSWGPMILGHAYEPVIEAVQQAAEHSTSFGAPTQIELKMANLVKEMVPGVDKIRMVNSGTEACMSAIRVARGYTGRDKIIKFEGNYHGHGDSFLIKAGSGALTLGAPDSPGVTEGTAQDTLTASYNDLDNVEKLLDEYEHEVAAIILEPIAGNMGCIPPQKGFLKGLRKLCNKHEVVLIFDEVMTGFRVAEGGAQECYGIAADLVTYGKIIGGGLPVGAFGGNKDIMSVVSPEGPVYQAGTLSGNPLAMAAGHVLLSELHNHPEIYDELEQKSALLADGLREIFNNHGVPVTLNRVGSMLGVFFSDQEMVDYKAVTSTDQELFKAFFHKMLKQGIYLPPSAFEAWFVANSITEKMIHRTMEAADRSLQNIQD